MSDISTQDFKDFVGSKHDYYVPLFQKFSSLGGNFCASWNWAAFFFPQMWLFYRKMYLFGLVALFASCVFNFIGWIVSGIVVGLCGNCWYFYHSRKKILSLHESFPNEDISEKLNILGGTNPIVVWIVALINIVAFLLFASPFIALLAFSK